MSNKPKMSWLLKWYREQALIVILALIVLIAFVCGIFALAALAFMWAWNTAIVYIFGAPEIGFWVSFALIWIIAVIGGQFRSSN